MNDRLRQLELRREEILQGEKVALQGIVEDPDYLDGILASIRTSWMKVLVWGPDPSSGTPLAGKRIEIRDALIQEGHDAVFTEEVVPKDSLLNLSTFELVMAIGYDYIVCIMASPGSIGEVHDFCHEQSIAQKMIICLDKAHAQGYSALGVIQIFEGHHGHLIWFTTPDDIESCNLKTMTLTQVQAKAAARQDRIIRSLTT